MSTYEPPGSANDDDEGNSIASSIEAPPFALGQDEDNTQGPTSDTAASVPTSPQPDTIYISPNRETTESHIWSSVTSDDEKSMFESNPSLSLQDNRTHHVVSQVIARPTDQEEGVETLVFDGHESLLGSSTPMLLGQSSHLPESGMLWTVHDSTNNLHTTTTTGAGSLDFSQLMRQADDRNQSTIVQSRMPPLPEDEEMTGLVDSGQTPTSTDSSNVTPRTTNRSEHNNWLYSMLFGGPSSSSRGGNLSAVPLMSLSTSHVSDPQLMSTTHQQVGGSRNIRGTRLGENTFQVSMLIDPPCTVRDVMDVVGNPDLLRLWCDPIRALVITKSSEGARSATNRREEGGDREYEGEWIEGTTSTLVSPSKHSSCLYNLGRIMWTSLGFPSYGKITMFVERRRGQVGLTIGPFSGGIVASHTINVQEDGDYISVVDRVRLSRDEEHLCCCGLCDPIRRCFMPRMVDHMEQVLSSMLRLRMLVEHGESTGSYAPELDHHGGVSRTPLLT